MQLNVIPQSRKYALACFYIDGGGVARRATVIGVILNLTCKEIIQFSLWNIGVKTEEL